ncbi:hypothetical protein HOT45_gp46 [Gordonia phage Trine]|uniref:Uncharacterized protein n=1 Tax=Gordonia phage Trine TaxID=2201431 RepID=A0A2Z4Q8Z5_9CAUD|nr:hypothetical protein HOT45_gp46 [Gordonia phage Trine]AWY06547.1 hypothetical protein PBI_TRINE_46 [Gordonia phage Trine]
MNATTAKAARFAALSAELGGATKILFVAEHNGRTFTRASSTMVYTHVVVVSHSTTGETGTGTWTGQGMAAARENVLEARARFATLAAQDPDNAEYRDATIEAVEVRALAAKSPEAKAAVKAEKAQKAAALAARRRRLGLD